MNSALSSRRFETAQARSTTPESLAAALQPATVSSRSLDVSLAWPKIPASAARFAAASTLSLRRKTLEPSRSHDVSPMEQATRLLVPCVALEQLLAVSRAPSHLRDVPAVEQATRWHLQSPTLAAAQLYLHWPAFLLLRSAVSTTLCPTVTSPVGAWLESVQVELPREPRLSNPRSAAASYPACAPLPTAALRDAQVRR